MTERVGYPDKPSETSFYQDYPASFHNGAGGFSFADGHSEIRKWVDDRTIPPLRKSGYLPLDLVKSPNKKDIVWLQKRSTRNAQ